MKTAHAHQIKIKSADNILESQAQALSDVFKLFADKNRLRILLALYDHPQCGCDLVEQLGMTKSAISHQLAILRQSNIVAYEKEGKHAIYRLADEHIMQILTPAMIHIKEC